MANRTTNHDCDCDCHRADGGGLVCSDCAERHAARDIPVLLREFAREMDEEDDLPIAPKPKP